MLVRWPGKIKSGQVSHQVWAGWDFMPTAAALAGAKPPSGIDGISILPALLGQKQKEHEYLYWEFHEGGFAQAVLVGRWKAIRKGVNGHVELYDLQTDIKESRDLAASHAEIVRRVEEIMKSARTESEFWPAR
jgi:arylsulfatase A-like enzyme